MGAQPPPIPYSLDPIWSAPLRWLPYGRHRLGFIQPQHRLIEKRREQEEYEHRLEKEREQREHELLMSRRKFQLETNEMEPEMEKKLKANENRENMNYYVKEKISAGDQRNGT